MAGFVFGDNIFSMRCYGASLFAGSIWFCTLFFSTYGVSFHCANSRTVSGSNPGGVTPGIFSVATDGTMCPKNEYQGFPLGVKEAGA
jgi:hypothetical protein